MKKICKVCGQPYEAHGNSKTCSPECSKILINDSKNKASRKYYNRMKHDPEYMEQRRAYSKSWYYRMKEEDPDYYARRKFYQKLYERDHYNYERKEKRG